MSSATALRAPESAIFPGIMPEIAEFGEIPDIRQSINPQILLDGQQGAAIWRRVHDDRLHREVSQILRDLKDQNLILHVNTQHDPKAMMRAVHEQIAPELPGYNQHFLGDIARQAWLFASQTRAPHLHLRLSSHGHPVDALPDGDFTTYQVTAYDGIAKREGKIAKSTLDYSLGNTVSAARNTDVANDVQPAGRPFLFLRLGAQQTRDSMPASMQADLNAELALGNLADTVFAQPLENDIGPAQNIEQQLLKKIALLNVAAETARHPEAKPELKESFVKKLQENLKEIANPKVLAQVSVATAAVAVNIIRDIAMHHPAVAAHPTGVKITLAASRVAATVEKIAPLGVAQKLRLSPAAPAPTPALTLNGPTEQRMAAAMLHARVRQVETGFKNLNAPEARVRGEQLLDRRTVAFAQQQPWVSPALKLTLETLQRDMTARAPAPSAKIAKPEIKPELRTTAPQTQPVPAATQPARAPEAPRTTQASQKTPPRIQQTLQQVLVQTQELQTQLETKPQAPETRAEIKPESTQPHAQQPANTAAATAPETAPQGHVAPVTMPNMPPPFVMPSEPMINLFRPLAVDGALKPAEYQPPAPPPPIANDNGPAGPTVISVAAQPVPQVLIVPPEPVIAKPDPAALEQPHRAPVTHPDVPLAREILREIPPAVKVVEVAPDTRIEFKPPVTDKASHSPEREPCKCGQIHDGPCGVNLSNAKVEKKEYTDTMTDKPSQEPARRACGKTGCTGDCKDCLASQLAGNEKQLLSFMDGEILSRAPTGNTIKITAKKPVAQVGAAAPSF